MVPLLWLVAAGATVLTGGCATTRESPATQDAVAIATALLSPPPREEAPRDEAPRKEAKAAPEPQERERLAALAAESQRLMAELAAAQKQIAQLEDTVGRQAKELETIAAVPPKGAAASVESERPSAATNAQPDPERAYADALELVRSGRHAEGARQLADFLARFPSHLLAPNAQYWIGEARYARHDFRGAAEAFKTVLAMPGSARKAPDALLMLAKSHRALGRREEARQAARQLLREHPRSSAAEQARQLLSELGRRGASRPGS